MLILETSGRTGTVGLAHGAGMLAERALDQSQKQARDLAPAIEELLRGQGWRTRDLDAVIVSLGPGSYTGLRVGVTSAKTLCYAINAAAIGVETFSAIAQQAPDVAEPVDVIADAQQDKVYWQSFDRCDEARARQATNDLTICRIDDWLAWRDGDAWVSGPGVSKHRSRLPGDLRLVDEEKRQPGLAALLALGHKRYREGRVSELWAIEPIYLRPSAAEEQWMRMREKDSNR